MKQLSACDWARKHDLYVAWFTAVPETLSLQDLWRTCADPAWMLKALHALKHRSFPGLSGPRCYAVDCVTHVLGEVHKPWVYPLFKLVHESERFGQGTLAWEDTFATFNQVLGAWTKQKASMLYRPRSLLTQAALATSSAVASNAAMGAIRYLSFVGTTDDRSWMVNRLHDYVAEWPGR